MEYQIYHNTFSGAVQHAWAVAEMQGYRVDADDWDRKVALGPRKPGTGKTNRYIINLAGSRPARYLHMQIYNIGSKYELNMYID